MSAFRKVNIADLMDVSRSKAESAVFVLDQDTSECLHYEPTMGYPPKNITKIPRDILGSHSNIEIRNDLIDCSIDVCALEARGRCSGVYSTQLSNDFCRYRRYSKTTSTMAISGGTSCTAYSPRIYS